MAIEHDKLHTYQELFCHQRDFFAQQTNTGSYFLRRQPVTDRVIHDHLEGRTTVGFYALSPNGNTTRWLVLDADRPDGLEQLQHAANCLDGRGIPSHLELSRRGGHLWVL